MSKKQQSEQNERWVKGTGEKSPRGHTRADGSIELTEYIIDGVGSREGVEEMGLKGLGEEKRRWKALCPKATKKKYLKEADEASIERETQRMEARRRRSS